MTTTPSGGGTRAWIGAKSPAARPRLAAAASGWSPARMERGEIAAVAPPHRGAGPMRDISHIDSRAVHDAEHRPAVLDEADQHGELAIARDKFLRAVERIDNPEAGRRLGETRFRPGFFADDRA